MRTIYLLSVFVHLLAMAVWVGGMGFLVLVIVPLLRQPAHRAQAMALLGESGTRFRTVGWVCLGLLVLTGAYNTTVRAGGLDALGSAAFWGSAFGRTLLVKLGLVLLILGVSAVHDFFIGPAAVARWQAEPGSAAATRMRRAASACGRLTLLLALGVVGLALVLVRG
jgi:putative copper export protein